MLVLLLLLLVKFLIHSINCDFPVSIIFKLNWKNEEAKKVEELVNDKKYKF